MRFSQRADSDMAKSIKNNCGYFGNPASWMSQSVKDSLQKQISTAFIDPGISIGLAADDFDSAGRPKLGFIEFPQMNEHQIEGRRQMQADRKELGGYSDAVKGMPVTANAPAELQRLTMSAASGVISSISKHLQGTIKHLATLMLHAQLHYLPVETVWKRCKRYKRPVLAAIHLKHGLEIQWKVDAMLASGAGSQRNQRRQELFTLNQTSNKLCDDETVQEAYNLDPETVASRNQRQQQQAMAMMPQQPQPQQAGKPAEEGHDVAEAGANGNGQGRMSSM